MAHGRVTRKALRQRIIEAICDAEADDIDFPYEWLASKAFDGDFTIQMMKREISLFALKADLEEYGVGSALMTEKWFERDKSKDAELTEAELRSYLPIGAGGAKSAGITKFPRAAHLSNLIQTEMSGRKSAKGKERIITEAKAGRIPTETAAISLKRIADTEQPSNMIDFKKLIHATPKRREVTG
jgi:hypothetical protein